MELCYTYRCCSNTTEGLPVSSLLMNISQVLRQYEGNVHSVLCQNVFMEYCLQDGALPCCGNYVLVSYCLMTCFISIFVTQFRCSGSYLYQVIGDPKFADRVERITYNALPATLTGGKRPCCRIDRHIVLTKNCLDMWARQYLQQQNQIAAQNMNP